MQDYNLCQSVPVNSVPSLSLLLWLELRTPGLGYEQHSPSQTQQGMLQIVTEILAGIFKLC